MRKQATHAIAAAAVIGALMGCSHANDPSEKNFVQALNTYYQDHNDCLFPQGHEFPYEVAPGTNAKEEKKQMDALMDAGLATRIEDRDMHVDRYTLNAAGNRYGPRFCYGHRQVTGMVSFTPPAPKDGFNETAVTYRYTEIDVPLWAQTDQVKGAFPQVAQALGAAPTATTTLASAGAGWQVPQ